MFDGLCPKPRPTGISLSLRGKLLFQRGGFADAPMTSGMHDRSHRGQTEGSSVYNRSQCRRRLGLPPGYRSF
jgi:hypothetical protein